MFGSFLAGQIAHAGRSALQIGRGSRYRELALEWVNRDPRVRHRAVTKGRPEEIVLKKLASAIVSIDIRDEPGLGIDVNDVLGLERVDAWTWIGLDHVSIAQLPGFWARARAAVSLASYGWNMLSVYALEDMSLTEKSIVVGLRLCVKACVVIRIPGTITGCSSVDRFVQSSNAMRRRCTRYRPLSADPRSGNE